MDDQDRSTNVLIFILLFKQWFGK